MNFKKTLCTALSLSILLGSAPAASAKTLPIRETPEATVYGDATLDDVVDVSDAVLIARYAMEDWNVRISQNGIANADVNLDTYVDTDDVVWILQYIAKLRPELGTEDIMPEPDYHARNLMKDIAAAEVKGKDADDAFLNAQLTLTANLLREASQQTQDKNLLISPLSISLALGMTANGAKGDTRTEMESVLGGDLDMDALNQYYYDYVTKLPDSKRASLDIANSIWFRDDENRVQVPETFLQTAKDYYNAAVFRAPFDDTTLEDVNGWVNYNTHTMIPKILDTVSPDHVMYLINALAFEADWLEPYNEYSVTNGKFTPENGKAVEVEMMYGEESRYIEDKQSTGFIKPYCNGYSFAAILPNEGVTVSDYIENMSAQSIQTLLKNAEFAHVITQMPKFSFAYDIKLNQTLQNLGMQSAFSARADFTGLNSIPGTSIDYVLHKTFITVDERGTRAGAATIVAATDECWFEPKEVYLDRPFLFMILDDRTQLPIFIGCVMNPAAKSS